MIGRLEECIHSIGICRGRLERCRGVEGVVGDGRRVLGREHREMLGRLSGISREAWGMAVGV